MGECGGGPCSGSYCYWISCTGQKACQTSALLPHPPPGRRVPCQNLPNLLMSHCPHLASTGCFQWQRVEVNSLCPTGLSVHSPPLLMYNLESIAWLSGPPSRVACWNGETMQTLGAASLAPGAHKGTYMSAGLAPWASGNSALSSRLGPRVALTAAWYNASRRILCQEMRG